MEGLYWGDFARDKTFERFKELATPDTIDAIDQYGYTALSYAVIHRQPECFAYALQCGADVNQTLQNGDHEPTTLLHMIELSGCHLMYAICLLKKGCNVNARNYYGETPLHIAAANGRSNYVALLLENKADVNACDECGDTPLDAIASTPRQNDLQCARTILLAGGKMGTDDGDGGKRYVDSEILGMRARFARCRMACRALQRALAHQRKIHRDVIPMVAAALWDTKDDGRWI